MKVVQLPKMDFCTYKIVVQVRCQIMLNYGNMLDPQVAIFLKWSKEYVVHVEAVLENVSSSSEVKDLSV